MPKWRRKLGGPAKVGLFFAALAIAMSVVGLIREHNTSPMSWLLAILISSIGWGLVSWAIATAVIEVGEEGNGQEENSGRSEG